MKYKPRDYQQEAIDRGLEFFNSLSKENGIMVLPVGAGKSVVIAHIAASLDGDVLILQPSKELTEQNFEKIVSCGMNTVSIYSASLNSKKIDKITLATIGSIYKKTDLFKHFKYVIIDEVDNVNPQAGMYKKLLDNLLNSKVLGLTATPFRMYRNSLGSEFRFTTRTRPRVFKKLLYYVQNDYLFNNNYLTKLEYYKMKIIDSTKLKVNSTGLDYVDSSVKSYYAQIDLNSRLAEIVHRILAKRPNMLVFTKYVEEAEYVAEILGDRAAVVSAKTKKAERERIIREYKAGKIKVVLNVGTLTVGFDFPSLSTILVARPTRSLRLWIQMVGRGSRIAPGKENAWIIDIAGAYERFGKIEDIRIENQGNEKWILRNKERQLTNVYLDQSDYIPQNNNSNHSFAISYLNH